MKQNINIATRVYATDAIIWKRKDSTPECPLFDCWLAGAANIFPTLVYNPACTKDQADRWFEMVERRAQAYNDHAKIDRENNIVDSVVIVTKVETSSREALGE